MAHTEHVTIDGHQVALREYRWWPDDKVMVNGICVCNAQANYPTLIEVESAIHKHHIEQGVTVKEIFACDYVLCPGVHENSEQVCSSERVDADNKRGTEMCFESQAGGNVKAFLPNGLGNGEDWLMGFWFHDQSKGSFRISHDGKAPSEMLGAVGYIHADLTAWINLMNSFGRV
jgi:hypothetical protein